MRTQPSPSTARPWTGALQPKDDRFGPVERRYGYRWLAQKSRPRTVRGALSRQRNRRRYPAGADGRRSREAWRAARASQASSQSYLRFGCRRDIGGARRIDRCEAARRRRAAAADGDVLRPRRLDGLVDAGRPGGTAREDPRLCFSPLVTDE